MQRSFIISLSQEYYSEKVCLSQYDSDYAVNFEVLDKGAKAPINGMTAYFEGTRCDGLSFRYTGTASDNVISFTIDTALTAVAGKHTGEIVLYDGSGLWFGSANVQILVEKAARPDNAIDANVTSQQTLLEQITSLAEQTEDAADAVINMTVSAQTLAQGADATVTKTEVGGVVNLHFGLPLAAGAGGEVTEEEFNQLKEEFSAMSTATSSDVGKALKVKTVTDGKVTEWGFGDVSDYNGYNGVVSGTTLASNNKVGFYSVGGFSTTVVSHMTDMPCDDFAGGYLLNTYVGSAGTVIKQTLVENGSGITKGRIFTKVTGSSWFGIGYINWVAFGDSITHGSYSTSDGQTLNDAKHSYAFRIAKNLRHDAVAKFYNCGVRGIGWVNTGNNGETFADMMALFTGDKTAINLVTIMLGINDYISLETLGTTSSAENDGTISGAIRYGLRYLCENYPNAKIIAISPLNSMNHGTAATGWSRNTRLTLPGSLQDVCDMIAYWCNIYNVTYINEISESFLNNYNMPTFLGDNLHPTDEGQWMLARELSEKIFTGVSGRDGTDGQDGYSPTVTITTITGGHRITITDANGSHSADVMDGTTPSLTNYVQFTDLATTSKAGAMSAQDKGRLDTVYADYSSALTALGVI